MLSSLSASQLAELQCDGSFHSYRKSFFVSGCAVEVRDASLGEILQFIPSYQRDVVLLSYFLGYTDLEISKILRIKKSTIHYRRNAALHRLRHMLEVMGHE